MSLTLRTARPEDAQRLLDIYAPYVLRTAVTFEYEVPSLEEFRRRIENILRKYPYLAAEEDGQIVGYAPEEDTHLSNDSVRFHEHMGYRMAARLHQCGYKFDTWYDMVYMEKMIGAHKKAPEMVTPFLELGK